MNTSDLDTISFLIRVAQDDQEIHKQLTYILSLNSFHRTSVINTMLENMNLNKAPNEIIKAMSCLLEDEFVEKVRLLIQS